MALQSTGKRRKGAEGVGQKATEQGGLGGGTEVGCVGNTWRGLLRMGKARGRCRRGGSWRTEGKKKHKGKQM